MRRSAIAIVAIFGLSAPAMAEPLVTQAEYDAAVIQCNQAIALECLGYQLAHVIILPPTEQNRERVGFLGEMLLAAGLDEQASRVLQSGPTSSRLLITQNWRQAYNASLDENRNVIYEVVSNSTVAYSEIFRKLIDLGHIEQVKALIQTEDFGPDSSQASVAESLVMGLIYGNNLAAAEDILSVAPQDQFSSWPYDYLLNKLIERQLSQGLIDDAQRVAMRYAPTDGQCSFDVNAAASLAFHDPDATILRALATDLTAVGNEFGFGSILTRCAIIRAGALLDLGQTDQALAALAAIEDRLLMRFSNRSGEDENHARLAVLYARLGKTAQSQEHLAVARDQAQRRSPQRQHFIQWHLLYAQARIHAIQGAPLDFSALLGDIDGVGHDLRAPRAEINRFATSLIDEGDYQTALAIFDLFDPETPGYYEIRNIQSHAIEWLAARGDSDAILQIIANLTVPYEIEGAQIQMAHALFAARRDDEAITLLMALQPAADAGRMFAISQAFIIHKQTDHAVVVMQNFYRNRIESAGRLTDAELARLVYMLRLIDNSE